MITKFILEFKYYPSNDTNLLLPGYATEGMNHALSASLSMSRFKQSFFDTFTVFLKSYEISSMCIKNYVQIHCMDFSMGCKYKTIDLF